MSEKPRKTNWPLLFLRIAVGLVVLAVLIPVVYLGFNMLLWWWLT
jgi:hypothetical protein